jgi:ribosomal protein L11 methylase PrmA
MNEGNVLGSFRDPSGFLFVHDGVIYRQVNALYQGQYDHLLESGLYQELVDAGLLIAHIEAELNLARSDDAYKIIRPEEVPFVSYPYEWSFSQLKAAALATLEIQRRALAFGMSLKDSSAYNIQFVEGKPILIDTLSFEVYQEGLPWVAYRQFCQHFLAPLALMSYKDIRLNQLLRVYIDGIPLDLAASLLPFRSRFKLPLLLHIHLHAKSQQHYSDKVVDRDRARGRVSRHSLLGLVDNLESAVKKLQWSPQGTAWADYYQDDSYDSVGIEHKKQLVADFLDEAAPKTVWDLGSNIGLFSRIAASKNVQTISWDIDPQCVDINYRQVVSNGETNLLPLVLDLTNPSPSIGWENRERLSILERGPADTVLALALVHHLAISNNVPLDRIADFLTKLCSWLIIEFVPKSDPKVQRLLSTREDIFPDYTRQGFENEFGRLFVMKRSEQIRNSNRILYLMERR